MQNNKEKEMKLKNNNRIRGIRINKLKDYFDNSENPINNSLVLYTLIFDCPLNAPSSDHIEQFNFKAKAKYGKSFLCGDNSFALVKNLLYSDFGIISIFFSSNENKNINSISSIEEYLFIFSLSFNNSSKTKSGEINLKSLDGNNLNRYLLEESLLKKENNIFASTTKNIYFTYFIYNNQDACLSATLCFNSSPNLLANSSFILLFFSNSSAILNKNASLNFSFNADLTIPFNSSLPNLLTAYSKSLGTDIKMFAMFNDLVIEVYKVFDLKSGNKI